MLAITNATVVLPDHYLPNGTILTEQGKIVAVGVGIAIPSGCEVLDAKGQYVGPGLVDIHTHAGGGKLFQENPEEASSFLLEHGVTSVLPALYFTLSKEGYLAAVELIEKARAAGKAPNIDGYYMEGPYLNPKYGADREQNKWGGRVNKKDYEEIIKYLGDKAKVWCVAPEREGIEEFVRDAKAINPNVSFSVAHSEASPAEIEKLMPYGLRIATHHTNATGKLEKYPECHGVCVDETVWYNHEIYAELICDKKGIHVDPYMLRLVRKIKGDDRVIIIADAFVSDGPVPDGYEGANDINFDWEGEISGTKLTLDNVCRNMMVHTGTSVCEAFRFASFNPAKAAGLEGRGEIKEGNAANLIVVDDWFHVQHIILKGELLK